MFKEEPGTAQQLAGSFNVTMDGWPSRRRGQGVLTLAASAGPLRHSELMKSDYMHMESVALNMAMQLWKLCMPLNCVHLVQEQQSSFSSAHLSRTFFNEYFIFSCLFVLLQEVGSIIGKVCYFY